MKQKTKKQKNFTKRALAIVVALLGSCQQPFASVGAGQADDVHQPSFLGGVQLNAASPAPLPASRGRSPFAAYDPEAIGPVLAEAATAEASGIDTMQTAAIIPGVFGSVAIPMRNFPVSARWAPVYRAIGDCSAGECSKNSSGFANIVSSAKGKGFQDKLSSINRGVNSLISYKRDETIYGSTDYWAKPAEILRRNAGDCEDFAILKMAALLDVGIPAQSMSLIVLQDRHNRVFHAVLSVATGSGTFILDNVRDNVVKDTSLPDYVPLYSFSMGRAWIHGSKPGGAQLAETKGGLAAIAPGEGPGRIEADASALTAAKTTGRR